MRGRTRVAAVVAVAAIAVAAGPRARMGSLAGAPDIGADVEAYLRAAEAEVPDVREGDGKRVVWADPERRDRTPLALVYLHGFSADPHEVDPLVPDLGRHLGANVYFTRLAGHGRTPAAMGEATVAAWLMDAAEAVRVGQEIGERVVVIGTSTGGTLALWAAMQPELADGIAGLVLLSPNLHPRNRLTRLLLWPWGGWIGRVVEGPERCFETRGALHARHWTSCYPTRALLPMMALVEHVRTADLGRVRAPTLVLYARDDQVVDPVETERAFAAFGAPVKALEPITEVGDPDRHVIAGDALSPGTTGRVGELIVAFLGEAGLAPGAPH